MSQDERPPASSAGTGAPVSAPSSAQNLVIPPFLLLLSCVLFGIVIALRWSAYRLIRKLILFCMVGLVLIAGYFAVEKCEACNKFVVSLAIKICDPCGSSAALLIKS